MRQRRQKRNTKLEERKDAEKIKLIDIKSREIEKDKEIDIDKKITHRKKL